MTGELFAAYGGLFAASFLAATLMPGSSEVALVGLLLSHMGEPAFLVALATLGNTLGSLANWACGRFLLRFQKARWFPVSRMQIDRGSAIFERYGSWTLLFAWAPLVGDALTLVAGILRVRLPLFLLLVGTGKFLRYLFVTGATFGLM